MAEDSDDSDVEMMEVKNANSLGDYAHTRHGE
jgi:hypothetical protein